MNNRDLDDSLKFWVNEIEEMIDSGHVRKIDLYEGTDCETFYLGQSIDYGWIVIGKSSDFPALCNTIRTAPRAINGYPAW